MTNRVPVLSSCFPVRTGLPSGHPIKLARFLVALTVLFHLCTGAGYERVVISAQEPGGPTLGARTRPPIQTFELGQPAERELPSGVVHAYSLAVREGEFLQAVVDQRGIDLVVALFGSDGQQLTEIDRQKGPSGSERVLFVVETSGSYRLEVRSSDEKATGRYEVRIEERRPAVAQDRSRAAAERTFFNTQALQLHPELGDRDGEAKDLSNVGDSSGSLDDPRRALESYVRALQLQRQLGYKSLGEPQKALDYYLQALKLQRELGFRWGEAATLQSLGEIYSSISDYQNALRYFNQALSVSRELTDRQGQAYTLNRIGDVYTSLGAHQNALDLFERALTLNRTSGDQIQEAQTLARIARVERDRRDYIAARGHSEAALAIFESVRTKVANPELRASYFASVQEQYEFYIDLMMRLHKERPTEGFAAVALQASERARARSLLELLTEARADIRQGVNPVLLQHERTLGQRLNAKAEQQLRLLGGAHTEGQAAAIAQEIGAFTAEYREVQAQIRSTSPRYAALTQPTSLSLSEVQQLLDSDTLLLEYALGEERSYVWAVTRTALMGAELPRRAEIEAAARRLYDLVRAPERDRQTTKQGETRESLAAEYRREASALSQMLLGPVASQLRAKRLLFVTDGALQYVPFGALPVPDGQATGGSVANESSPQGEASGHHALGTSNVRAPDLCSTITGGCPLIVKHELVSLPSASALAVLRSEIAGREARSKKIAVIADPVFDRDDIRVRRRTDRAVGTPEQVSDPAGSDTCDGAASPSSELERALRTVGLTATSGRIPRLPFSRREAERILALVPAGSGFKAVDFDASRTTATTSLGEYQIVHFATHGLINSEHPELSGLVLSLVDERGDPQDGFVRLHDIYNLSLPADLVVLSACQTALGEEIKGEGFVGLTRGFFYAGAARLMASLWKVDDAATAELMTRFYRAMFQDNLRPAAALRRAQVELWSGRRWQAPYYWAAFFLQGEWR